MKKPKDLFSDWYFSEHSEAGDNDQYTELYNVYMVGYKQGAKDKLRNLVLFCEAGGDLEDISIAANEE